MPDDEAQVCLLVGDLRRLRSRDPDRTRDRRRDRRISPLQTWHGTQTRPEPRSAPSYCGPLGIGDASFEMTTGGELGVTGRCGGCATRGATIASEAVDDVGGHSSRPTSLHSRWTLTTMCCGGARLLSMEWMMGLCDDFRSGTGSEVSKN